MSARAYDICHAQAFVINDTENLRFSQQIITPKSFSSVFIIFSKLAAKLDVHGRHCMLSYLSSLPISVLSSFDTEANKFYDRTNRLYDAALLTRGVILNMVFV